MIPNFITNLKRRRLSFAVALAILGITSTLLFGGAQTAFAETALAKMSFAQVALTQTCMGDEGFGPDPDGNTYVQGMQNAEDLNCTANDVVIARTDLVSVDGVPNTGQPFECFEGQVLTVELLADLESNSQARRSDIGIWIANDGGDAISGDCSHFYFLAPDLAELDVIADGCRDIGAQVLYPAVPLDTPVSSLDVVCRDESGNGLLDVGSCIGWKIPGDDLVCPDDQDGTPPPGQLSDYIKGTLPANKAKCRCSNIEIPITVKKTAHIEVIKDVEPDWAAGLFNLQIDAVTESADVGDGGTTGKVEVSAGTSQDPGATHTVGETAGTNTVLAAYDSSIECVDRGEDTFNGGAPLTLAGAGPLTVPVMPDDDIVCTITNTRLPGGIEVTKRGDNLTKVGDEVNYRVDILNNGAGQFPVYLDEIDDSLALNLKSNYIDNTCDDTAYILGYMESCYITYTHTVTAEDVIPNPATPPPDKVVMNTVTVVAYDPNGPSSDSFTDSDDKYVDVFEPAIGLTKEGSPTLMIEGTQVNYTITLTGNSTPNTPPMTCTITDPALGGILQSGINLTWDGTVTLTPSKVWDFDGADAAYCTEAGGQYECTNTATVSCDITGFEGLNELDDEDSKTVAVIPADVALSLTKDCSDYSKVETWEGWTDADKIDYEIVIENLSGIALNITNVDDTVLGSLTDCNGLLAAYADCTIKASYAVPEAQDGDSITNEVTVTFNDGLGGGDITFPDEFGTPVSCTTDLVHPAYTVDKSCASPDPVPAGATANFDIRIANTGDVPLEVDVADNDFEPPLSLTDVYLNSRASACGDDDFGNAGTVAGDANDGCLLLRGGMTATGETVSNLVTTHATLPAIYELSNELDRRSNDTCEVEQGDATRTWGFWKTHADYACHVFEVHMGGTMDLGWKTVTSCEELYAMFWAHRSWQTDGDKRKKGCATQVRCSGQVQAAQLNAALDNGAYLDPADLAAVLNALAGGNFKAINTACAPIGGYNESGDDVAIIDLDGYMIEPADPNFARDNAYFPFADCNQP